jgi:hypothetical protein
MKEKHLAREQREGKNIYQSLNKISHPKVQNTQWGALKGEIKKPRI